MMPKWKKSIRIIDADRLESREQLHMYMLII